VFRPGLQPRGVYSILSANRGIGEALWDSEEKSRVYVEGCPWELSAEDCVVKSGTLPPKSLAFVSVSASVSSVLICVGALVHIVESNDVIEVRGFGSHGISEPTD